MFIFYRHAQLLGRRSAESACVAADDPRLKEIEGKISDEQSCPNVQGDLTLDRYVNTTNATALVASVYSRTTTECYEGIFATGIGARFRIEIRLPCSENSRQSRTSMFFN